jgi:exo-1,4-beta-D-glucosaminidase
MTALNTMPQVKLEISAKRTAADSEKHVVIYLHNPSEHIAFFERATVSVNQNGDEALPIEYDDNYITVYPGETVEIHATVSRAAEARWIKLEGYNSPLTSAEIK